MEGIAGVLIKRIRLPEWCAIKEAEEDRDSEWMEYRTELTRLYTNLTLV